MRFEFQIQDGVVFSRFLGRVTGADILDHARYLAGLETESEVSPDRLTDLSATDAMDVVFEDIERLAKVRRSAPLRNPIRSAIVAPKDIQYGLARMFQTLNDNPEIILEVFRDTASARQWLNLD